MSLASNIHELLLGGSAGYQIPNSLRFRSSASAYLNRTPASAGNQKTWTWSGWVKLGAGVTSGTNLFGCTTDGYNVNYFALYFGSGQTLRFENVTAGAAVFAGNITSQVFRDYSAWYHIVLAVDTTQATAANRLKFYVNGSQVTSWSQTSYPSQNANTLVNTTIPHEISSSSGLAPFDGYLADINFIDGQALSPTAFGQYSPTTGVWIPASYTGTYGTNGFHLNFSNGTSTTTLGYDSSGNSNNWTTNNISLTAGSAYDWMIDSPTSFAGTSYGVGNYAVLNPLLTSGSTSQGNLAFFPVSTYSVGYASIAVTSGKWYWEVYPSSISGGGPIELGFCAQSNGVANRIYAGGYSYQNNGGMYALGVSLTPNATYTSSDIISFALDMDAGTCVIYKNNVAQSSQFSGITGSISPAITLYAPQITGNTFFNFGQRPFAYTPPSGYKSLCTQNLPTPSILAGNKYMDVSLYTGNGSSQAVTNSGGFQPDLVWCKQRSGAGKNNLLDSIRGRSSLFSDTTEAELALNAGYDFLTFNSNGFTLGTPQQTAINNTGATNVGWQWKAGGTAVTNTAGSITSQVSANPTAGFSVVTYTGNGTLAASVGHGLGVAPNMIFIKRRDTTAQDWGVYTTVGGLKLLQLNTENAWWNSGTDYWYAAATSSVFYPDTAYGDHYQNTSGATYVAYCFAAIAGYSAFGSYTGNGSADGPFVYCGFRPRYVLIKLTGSISGYGNWRVLDSSRNTYNVTNSPLNPDHSGAEDTNNSAFNVDFLSNGFKLRTTYNDMNASGYTYIYAAFAENPFKYSLGR